MNDIVRHRIFILSALFILITNILMPASAIGIQKPLVIPDVGRINDDFDDTMLEYMDNGHMPSLAVAIIKNDRMVWSKGYGYADTKNKVEATNKTVYMLASISKTFAATAIMQLWEKGLFDLDDDINEYLPFSIRNPQYPDIPITFRMLLTHRSSIASRAVNIFTLFSLLQIPYDNLGEYLSPGGRLYSPKNWNEYAPGERQSYSCAAYELLGYLVEQLTNLTYPEYCTKNIFEPLGMRNTSYHPSDFTKEQLAIQYIYLVRRYIPLPEFEDRNYASGGLRSNLEDLSHYLIAFMNGGTYNGEKILNNDTINLIFTEQYPNEHFIGYGLGWQIFSGHNGSENNLRIGHNGGMPGSQTYMFYHVSEDAGIIIFSNQHFSYTIDNLRSWFSIIDLLVEKAKQY